MGTVTHGYYGADGACPRCQSLDCHWGTNGNGVAVGTCGNCGYRETVRPRGAVVMLPPAYGPNELAHLAPPPPPRAPSTKPHGNATVEAEMRRVVPTLPVSWVSRNAAAQICGVQPTAWRHREAVAVRLGLLERREMREGSLRWVEVRRVQG